MKNVLFACLLLVFVFVFSQVASGQCLQNCDNAHAICADESATGLSYSNISKTISTQAIDSPDFFSLNSAKLCYDLNCNDVRDACNAFALNFIFKSCAEECQKRGCNSTASCTLQMRKKFSECDAAYITCCQNSTSKKCGRPLIECRQACPPETFTVQQKCSAECPPGESQRPFPDCSCVSPPSAVVCSFEGTVETKKSTTPLWKPVSSNELLARGDSIRTGEGVVEVSFGESCSKPLLSLKPNSSIIVWDYSESNESKNQVVLVSNGAVKLMGTPGFLVHARQLTGWFSVESAESDYAVEATSYSGSVKVLRGAVEASKPDGENASASAGTMLLLLQTKNISSTIFSVENELASWQPKKQAETNWLLYAGVAVAAAIAFAGYWFFARKKREEE